MPGPEPTALLSLSDRSGLDELAGSLERGGFKLIATSGTAAAVRALGVRCADVEDVTAFPSALNGRVKTLHPKIFAGILARSDNAADAADLQRLGAPAIQLVAVTLYPFELAVSRPDAPLEDVIEKIDIGGVALLRAAAKNYGHVSVLSSPQQYAELTAALQAGGPDLAQRQRWASQAMMLVARYDAVIAGFFARPAGNDNVGDGLTLNLPLELPLRYGENPWAQAAFYRAPEPATNLSQLAGKTLSYNNLLDVDSCLRLLQPLAPPHGFPASVPAPQPVRAAIVKHTIPCGLAAASSARAALAAALGTDPVSAFGGIVGVNAAVDLESAELLKPRFLEVVAAPDFSAAAVRTLQSKKNLRLVVFDESLPEVLRMRPTLRSALGGVLVERPDPAAAPDEWRLMTGKEPGAQQWRDLLFAFGAVRQVKSNAAVVVKNEVTVGICGGQTNRVAAVELACNRAGPAALGAVLATDGFFPFADGIEAAIAAGVRAVVAPSGSIRDSAVVESARRAGIALVFTARRYFLH